MTPRYKLRTLLILLAVLPPVLFVGWTWYIVGQSERADKQQEPWIPTDPPDVPPEVMIERLKQASEQEREFLRRQQSSPGPLIEP